LILFQKLNHDRDHLFQKLDHVHLSQKLDHVHLSQKVELEQMALPVV
jgi:hypothetical protein